MEEVLPWVVIPFLHSTVLCPASPHLKHLNTTPPWFLKGALDALLELVILESVSTFLVGWLQDSVKVQVVPPILEVKG